MKISLITVSFNSSKTIKRTIDSVINQDYSGIEYIIIDGGSNDGTLDIINTYKDRISYFVSERDNGIYDAMNKGIAAATGEIVGILNSDDSYVDHRVVSDVINQIENTGCDAVYGDLIYVDPRTGKIVRKWQSGGYKRGMFKKGWMPPHPTFFVKKRMYEQYGGYNTSLKSSADYELMLRFIHKYRISLTYLPRTLVRMTAGGVSNASLGNRIRANREDGLAWSLNNLKRPFYTTWLKPLKKIGQKIDIKVI